MKKKIPQIIKCSQCCRAVFYASIKGDLIPQVNYVLFEDVSDVECKFLFLTGEFVGETCVATKNENGVYFFNGHFVTSDMKKDATASDYEILTIDMINEIAKGVNKQLQISHQNSMSHQSCECEWDNLDSENVM